MLSIRMMTAGDFALGDRLRAEAGWNQTEDDWRRFLHLQPDGCFVAEWDGRPAGTAVTCTFGPVAWVAMVLVDRSLRKLGIGTQLMNHALAWLDRRAVPSVRLDATPLGRPIYQKLGFMDEYELVRMQGVAPDTPAPREPQPCDLDLLCRVDEQVSATPRQRLLAALVEQQPDSVRTEADGYVLFRPGVNAVQIGPAGAWAPAVGQTLLDWALSRCAGRMVFVDIPVVNRPAIAWAAARGLVEQRRLMRMCRGPRPADRPPWIWASSGPEMG